MSDGPREPETFPELTPQDQFTELYDQAPCGLLAATPEGIVVAVNSTLLDWLGHRRAEVIGQPLIGLLTAGSRLFYETRYLPVLRLSGEVREIALTMRRADGQPLPVLVNASTRFDSHGEPTLVRTAIFDATQRQGFEHELVSAKRVAESSEARVRVLQGASTAFGACTTEAGLAAALVASAGTAFRARSTAVLLSTGDGQFRLAAGEHPLAPLSVLADPHPPGTAWLPEAEAVRLRAPVTVGGLTEASERSPALVEAMHGARLEALTVDPLLQGDNVLGLLVCFFGRARSVGDSERDLHSALGHQFVPVLERIRLQAELQEQALYDPLTGLANRHLLTHDLQAAVISARRRGTALALIFFDLDGFKAINDELGHSVGDAVLVDVAARLRAVVRGSDTVARFGGDEFVVVCEDVDTAATARLAERIRAAVRQPLGAPAGRHRVTASVGVAVHRPHSRATATGADLMREADAAMYESKRAGKDRITTVTVP